MVSALKKKTKGLLKGHLHLRVFMSCLFGLLFFALMPRLVDTAEWAWYKYADIDNFYELVSVVPTDICYGETEQEIIAVRKIHGTKFGYPADVHHEFFQVQSDGKLIKYGADYHTTPFVEVKEDNINERIFIHDKPLAIGEYKLRMTIAVALPQNVERGDIIYLTESFFVKDCIEQQLSWLNTN